MQRHRRAAGRPGTQSFSGAGLGGPPLPRCGPNASWGGTSQGGKDISPGRQLRRLNAFAPSRRRGRMNPGASREGRTSWCAPGYVLGRVLGPPGTVAPPTDAASGYSAALASSALRACRPDGQRRHGDAVTSNPRRRLRCPFTAADRTDQRAREGVGKVGVPWGICSDADASSALRARRPRGGDVSAAYAASASNPRRRLRCPFTAATGVRIPQGTPTFPRYLQRSRTCLSSPP